MTPLYPYQMPGQNEPAVEGIGILVQQFYFLLVALFNRTGGNSGNQSTVGSNLTATGTTQATALVLSNDYNEVLSGSGAGVAMAAMQPGQSQRVFNGTGGNVNIYPAFSGKIDALAVNAPYILANGKTQFFTCTGLLASGGLIYRSLQIG